MQVVIVQSRKLFDTYCMFLVTFSFMATYKKPYLKSELCVCVCACVFILYGSLHNDRSFASDTSPKNIKFGVTRLPTYV